MAKGQKTGGRVKGSRNKRTIARQHRLAEAQRQALAGVAEPAVLTPLQVMQMAMQAQVDAGELVGAAEIARDLAPYLHGKVASFVQVSGQLGVRRLSDDEIDARIAAILGPSGAAGAF
jgi:hypothetical protein